MPSLKQPQLFRVFPLVLSSWSRLTCFAFGRTNKRDRFHAGNTRGIRDKYFMIAQCVCLSSTLVASVYVGEALSSRTNVPLGEAIAVGLAIVSLVFWMGGFMRGVRDELKGLRKDFQSLSCQRRFTGQCPEDVDKPDSGD